jgi:hypothetical protein
MDAVRLALERLGMGGRGDDILRERFGLGVAIAELAGFSLMAPAACLGGSAGARVSVLVRTGH